MELLGTGNFRNNRKTVKDIIKFCAFDIDLDLWVHTGIA